MKTAPGNLSARDTILSRIAAALGPAAQQPDPHADWEKISRDYLRSDSLSGPPLLALFEHRLLDYGARVFPATPDNIRETAARLLADRAVKRMLIPAGLPPEWLPAEVSFTPDENLACAAINTFDGVFTAATIAIAATGSIVLQHGPGQGRRALSLIPDYHLCVVFTHQVVETVPTAFARLDSTRPTTFISGPSATADIEMTRIKGVHGPRFLDVILVG